MSNRYSYTPLSQGQIRLLHIHPANKFSTPIKTHLEAVNFSEKPYYKALSYVWGAKFGTIPLDCNESKVLITPNLQIALQWLRHPEQAKVFWVDAICINQEDMLERNSQVKLMRNIYEKASEVIVWLGEQPVQFEEPSLTLSVAFKILQHNAATFAPIFAGVVDLPRLKDELSVFEDIPELAPRALHALIAYPWFTRMWIIQEAAVNPNTTIICGSDRIAWGEFAQVVQVASENTAIEELSRIEVNNINRCKALVSVKNIVQDVNFAQPGDQLGRTSLSSLLAFSQLFSATDPRDKVFALLGLASDVVAGQDSLQPDYRLSIEEVFQRFARFIIVKEKSLDILHRVGVYRSLTMPSWVPDWSVNTNEGRLPLDGFNSINGFGSDDDENVLKTYQKLEIEDMTEHDLLKLRGKTLSSVKFVGLQLAIKEKSTSFKEDFSEVGAGWERIAAEEATRLNDDKKLRIYIDTIMGGVQKQGLDWRKDGSLAWYNEFGSHFFTSPEDKTKYGDDDEGDVNQGTDSESNMSSSEEEQEKDVHSENRPSSEDDSEDEDEDADAATGEELSVQECSRKEERQADLDAKSTNRSSESDDSDAWSYDQPSKESAINKCTSKVAEACYGRKLIVTEDGKMGLAPFSAKVGDFLVFFPGGSLPFIVRRCGEGIFEDRCKYILVGNCYISGFDPSAIMNDETNELQVFTLC